MATKKTASRANPAASSSLLSALLSRLTEPSTWAGLLTIGSALATGGLASWLNPETLPVLIAGVGLVLTKDFTPPKTQLKNSEE